MLIDFLSLLSYLPCAKYFYTYIIYFDPYICKFHTIRNSRSFCISKLHKCSVPKILLFSLYQNRRSYAVWLQEIFFVCFVCLLLTWVYSRNINEILHRIFNYSINPSWVSLDTLVKLYTCAGHTYALKAVFHKLLWVFLIYLHCTCGLALSPQFSIAKAKI